LAKPTIEFVQNVGGTKEVVVMINSCGIILINKDKRFLLLRNEDYWDFPKGKTELKDIYFVGTALRELREETDLFRVNFLWGYDFYSTEPYSKPLKIAHYYLGFTDHNETDVLLPISEELGKPEHDEYRWLEYEDAILLLNERVKKTLDWAVEKIKIKDLDQNDNGDL
jgi:bis(5'-nucleosidyl)-tetraphosphatase